MSLLFSVICFRLYIAIWTDKKFADHLRTEGVNCVMEYRSSSPVLSACFLEEDSLPAWVNIDGVTLILSVTPMEINWAVIAVFDPSPVSTISHLLSAHTLSALGP